jgi:hypothetical protein
MSNPTFALNSSASARSALPADPAREPSDEGLRRALQVSQHRERRVRAEARWQRFVSVCRRELVRRDAEPGRR